MEGLAVSYLNTQKIQKKNVLEKTARRSAAAFVIIPT